MGKRQDLTKKQLAALTYLEAEYARFCEGQKDIPGITQHEVADNIRDECYKVLGQAAEITGFAMRMRVDVRTPDYVIVDLFPADEKPPAAARPLPEYDYALANNQLAKNNKTWTPVPVVSMIITGGEL